MDLEDMYNVLYADSQEDGASYAVVRQWFMECGIVDGKVLTEGHFIQSYERLGPNREPLSMTQFIQFIGILSRETRQSISVFLQRFGTVRSIIITEIQSRPPKPERDRPRDDEDPDFIENWQPDRNLE